MEELAATAPLTGLPSRTRLAEQVETALWDARVGDDGLAVLLVDVDGVHTANGLWGHAAGDELLRTVAGRLRAALRRRDLVARLSGHEFVVVLRDLDPRAADADARRAARAVLAAVRRPVVLAGTEAPVGVRVGLSVHPDDCAAFSELLRSAGLRRYE